MLCYTPLTLHAMFSPSNLHRGDADKSQDEKTEAEVDAPAKFFVGERNETAL